MLPAWITCIFSICHFHGLWRCPHRTRFALVFVRLLRTSPASIIVTGSAPVSGTGIMWWCNATIFVWFLYFFSVFSSHRFCLCPTSPSSLSGLALLRTIITVLSICVIWLKGKYCLKSK